MTAPAYGPKFSPDGIQRRWNSQSIAAAQKCLRYYDLSVRKRYRKNAAINEDIKFGSLYAEALQQYFLHRANGMDREAAIRAVVMTALVASWGWESTHPTKDRGSLIRTIVWYFEEFRKDIPVLHTETGPAVEKQFEIDIDFGNSFIGTMDRVVEYTPGSYFVMDQKTTKMTLSPSYFAQYKPNTQMSLYSWVGHAIFPEPIRGVIIDAAQVAVGFSRYQRDATYRTESELEEWYDSALYTIERAQTATREEYFPENPTACHQYGGCAFRDLCTRSPEVRGNFLKADYHQEEER